MASVIRKTEAKHYGPWLLDKESLLALDEVLQEQWMRLESRKTEMIEMATREAIERATESRRQYQQALGADDQERIRHEEANGPAYQQDRCAITLTLKSGNKIAVSSLKEAIEDVNCQEQWISELRVSVRCGGITADLRVPASSTFPYLSLVTLPEASDAADELFVRLNTWAERYRPNQIRQIRGLGFPLITFLGLLLLLLLTTLSQPLSVPPAEGDWATAARKLVDGGIRPEQYGTALELLLRQSAAFPKQEFPTHWPAWLVIALVAVALMTTLLSITARTSFEIGKGARGLAFQKKYDWFLRKAIPSFVVLGVVAGVLASYLFEWLH